jgi:hypothetical protein
MKNIFKVIGIIAIVAVIGFSMVACGGGDDGNNNNNNTSGTAPVITTASLPNGTVGTAYSQTLTATGDTPIIWSIESGGTLPEGLGINGYTGVISGTPSIAATSTFTVKATNDKGSNTKSLSITIAASGSSGGDTMTWTTVGDSKFGTSNIYAVAYSGSRFVTVGASGKMAYSDNGTTWTAVGDSKFGTTDIRSIVYGNGRFVAGGSMNNKLAWSSDGITWIAVGDSKFGSSWITDIAYGSNKFVAVGTGGTITYSTDNGITWTDASNSTIGTINSITYGGNRFVVVGTGKIAYSDNVTSWTVAADCKFASNANINGIAYGGGKFIAVGAGNPVYSSDNGVTWTTIDLTGYASYSGGIDYGNNMFYAWGNGSRLVTSPDGLTWKTTEQIGFSANDVVWGSNKFVVVGNSGKIAYSSGN